MAGLVRSNLRHLYRLSTANLRRKPDYMVIGAQKSGTTTLYRMLSQHPGVDNPLNKEMHFFDDRDIRSLRQYRGMFPFSSGRLTGEATPIYLYYPGVPQRIRALFPRCRFIAILRNPVDRAYAHYQMRLRRGKEPLSFEDAIAEEGDRLAQAWADHVPGVHNDGLLSHGYLDRGMYARQLESWLEHFQPAQFHLVCFERFLREPQEEYDRLCDFLGLQRHGGVVLERANTAAYEPMRETTRAELERLFEGPNRALFELIGEDFGWNAGAAS